jgi:hypothetical protein
LSIVISAFPNQKLSTLLYHNLLIVALDEGAYLATSQFSVNAIKSSTAKDLHPSQQSSLILSLLISEVSIFNFFQKVASFFKSYVKWFLLLIVFWLAIDISLPACCFFLFYSLLHLRHSLLFFLSNTMTAALKKGKQ